METFLSAAFRERGILKRGIRPVGLIRLFCITYNWPVSETQFTGVVVAYQSSPPDWRTGNPNEAINYF